MNKTELLEMALEKLTAASNYIDTLGGVSKGYRIDIERLKAALEAKDEPVALKMDVIVVNLVREGINKHRARELAEHFIKHTTTPPQRKPLTDEQPEVRTGNCLRVGVCASEGHKIQPQRTWVGLTDEEIIDLRSRYQAGLTGSVVDLIVQTAAKLKEKNT